MEKKEKLIFSNNFGSVSDKRVVLNYKSGSEEIPIGQITSISFQRIRNYFFAIASFVMIILILLALTRFWGFNGGVYVVIAILILFLALSGLANWIGHHNIVISAAGQNRKPLKVEMSKTMEGRQFADAVKKEIFK